MNLAAAGIQPGDWYLIYAVQPGLQVSVANDAAWRREPAEGWQQYSLRATGTATVTASGLAKGCSYQVPGQPWQELPAGAPLAIASAQDDAALVLIGKPAWLALDDGAAPQVTEPVSTASR